MADLPFIVLLCGWHPFNMCNILISPDFGTPKCGRLRSENKERREIVVFKDSGGQLW